MDFEKILREAGANVRPHDDESHRPEILNVLLARSESITGQTVSEMIAPAWPSKSYIDVAARLSRRPYKRMAEDIRDCLLAEGWYWRDTSDGCRWFPAEFDSSAWVETPQ